MAWRADITFAESSSSLITFLFLHLDVSSASFFLLRKETFGFHTCGTYCTSNVCVHAPRFPCQCVHTYPPPVFLHVQQHQSNDILLVPKNNYPFLCARATILSYVHGQMCANAKVQFVRLISIRSACIYGFHFFSIDEVFKYELRHVSQNSAKRKGQTDKNASLNASTTTKKW